MEVEGKITSKQEKETDTVNDRIKSAGRVERAVSRSHLKQKE